MIKIALDAMGGDHAPKAIIEGAVQAAQNSGGRFEIVLTGPQGIIEAELKSLGYQGGGIEIHHAPEMVAMDDSPSTVLKSKPNSGLVSCVTLQKEGRVQASLSAGNSGAMMAACLMILGRVGAIPRPAIACVLPAFGRKIVMVDCGANVDEKAQALYHFGICGSIYAENILKINNPKVGLLNVGEEEKKGPEVLQEAFQLFKKSSLNFYGNIEGRDILHGTTDVVVAPGYVGNVVLKLMEGFFELAMKSFGPLLKTTDEGKNFLKEWDYSNVGGALLLGLKGTGIITHGRADAKVICNGLETAYQMVKEEVAKKISERLSAETVAPDKG